MSDQRNEQGKFVEGHARLGGLPTVIPRTPENAARICEMIVSDTMSIDAIAKEMGANGKSTIFMWIAADPVFAEQYRQAKAAQAEVYADEILGIADDGSNDWEERVGRMGTPYRALNTEAVLRSRLRVDTRFRLMEKMAVRRYGPKVDHEHSGEITIRTTRYGDSAEVEALRPAYIDVTPADD